MYRVQVSDPKPVVLAEIICEFSQSLQATAMMLLQTGSQLLRSTFLSLSIRSPSDMLQTEFLAALYNL
jgi:hypothetical protein